MSQALIGIYRVVEMAVGIVNLVFLDRWLVRTGYRRILLWASLGLLVLYPIWLLTPGIWQRLVLSLPISFLFTVYWPIGKAQSLASVPGRGGTITAVQSLIGLVPLPLFFGFLADLISLTSAMFWTFTGGTVLMIITVLLFGGQRRSRRVESGLWVAEEKKITMVDYWQIYHTEAERYDRLVSREDRQGNLASALESICPLAGIRVVELGAGTGRISRLLTPHVSEILALDISAHMLEVARERLIIASRSRGGLRNWHLIEADNRRLPLRPGLAKLAIAGWSLGHFVGWYKQTWRQEIALVLSEMQRVIGPEGSLIVVETLGTGSQTPEPPTMGLASYYRWLEEEYGFTHRWIRTDYQFQSVTEAGDLTEFFFGKELANYVMKVGSTVLPECTGIWFQSPVA
ncbi:MAG TPA: methyltransferase domain-containing protein [Patescibacteria group bacterium]|nr:methyltransferase domain-containing protein [Patescibacteria group bacterium]